MIIKQFKDAALAHFSYAICSGGNVAVIDPSRNPLDYYKFASDNNAVITHVFETHPHADFVSSHLQISNETGATIYCSVETGADYPHQSLNHKEKLSIGNIEVEALLTPGHSADSMTFIFTSKEEKVMFSGDTLFIGNVGRPDLREKSGNIQSKREELAEMMYYSVHDILKNLDDDMLVYPAHGAGSLCGKNMSSATTGILRSEKQNNWAFKTTDKKDFIDELLKEQPMIPAYFSFDVETNKTGASNYAKSLGEIPVMIGVKNLDSDDLVVDWRDEALFKKGHLPNSINIMGYKLGHAFETWLGTLVQPKEDFYLVVEDPSRIEDAKDRTAKIGYDSFLKGIITLHPEFKENSNIKKIPAECLRDGGSAFTIVDVRNESEVQSNKIFNASINIPLNELADRAKEINTTKPIVVHCAAGYRSAAGSSILRNKLPEAQVFDLSDYVKEF